MAKKAFDGGRIFGVTHGSAPSRVLALPGWLHTAADWDATLRSLSADVGAVALDLPGFGGATPEPEEATGSAGYADRVEPVLRELAAATGGAPLVLVGHSFGGRVALQLAARHPDLAAGLVLTGVPKLVAPAGPPTKPAPAYRAARWLHRRGVLPDSKMEELRRKSGSADYRNAPSITMRNVLVAATNEVYEEQLRQVRCPVELVWGVDDTAAPIADVRRAAALLGERATLTELPGVDHFTPIKAPDALAAAVRRLL